MTEAWLIGWIIVLSLVSLGSVIAIEQLRKELKNNETKEAEIFHRIVTVLEKMAVGEKGDSN